eukprot:m.68656 g.68656  ORF g.68656 m.68656 type:complete len:1122 (-) comp11989_c0_seq1:74-3439(-)
MEGFLMKKGAFWKAWKRRWFVLTETSISYYAEDSRGPLKGEIEIENITEVKKVEKEKEAPDCPLHYVFSFVSDKRVYLLAVDSYTESERWIKAFEYCMECNKIRLEKLEEILPNGEPPASVQLWLNEAYYQEDDEKEREQAIAAIPWLVEAVTYAYLDRRLKDAARRLLLIPEFTRNLIFFRCFDPLKKALHKRLCDIGESLKKKYDSRDLGSQISDASIELETKIHRYFVPVHDKEEDITLLTVLPAPSQFFNFESQPEKMPDHVYLHAARMVHLAANQHFQDTVHAVARYAGCIGRRSVWVGRPKFFRRAMEAASRVHRYKQKPKSAYNLDLMRNTVVVPDVSTLHRVYRNLVLEFGGVARVKNEFTESRRDREAKFHLLSLVVTLPCELGMTYKSLSESENVKALWDKYLMDSECEPHEQWRRHVNEARAYLQSGFLEKEKVVVLGETKIMLQLHSRARFRMHEKYKIWRAPTDTSLYNDIRVSCGEKPPRTDERSLYGACLMGQLSVANRLIGFDADVNGQMAIWGGATPLWGAAEQGHIDVVHLLTNSNAHLDKCRRDGSSPLLAACQEGHADVVEYLLEHKASVEIHKQTGETPLFVASQNGYLDIVELILKQTMGSKPKLNGTTAHYESSILGESNFIRQLREAKVNLDVAGADGTTPVHAAAANGHNSIVRLLLDGNASVDQTDSTGATLLYAAAENGHQNVAELLLSRKVAIDKGRNDGATALLTASQNGHTHLVKLLLERNAWVDQADNDGITSLLIATQHGRLDAMKLLLDQKASVDLCLKDGASPLFIACQLGRSRAARLLLEMNGSVDQTRNDGETPLIAACMNGREHIVRLLVDANATIDKADNTNATPLCVAAAHGQKNIVEYLLGNGANVDHRKSDGTSPMLLAALNDHMEIVDLLLQNNADCNATDSNGTTLLLMASHLGQGDLVRRLITSHATVNLGSVDGITPLFVASLNGHTDILMTLIENGAELNRQEKTGASPLIAATEQGHFEAVELLITQRASINVTMKDGTSALHMACQKGYEDIVDLLLTKNMDPDQRMESGATSLFIACYKGNYDIVKSLIDASADVKTGTSEGTALSVALREGHAEVVQLLCKAAAKRFHALD